MPAQNPFLRRASSPGDFLNYKKRKSFAKLPVLPQQRAEMDNEKQQLEKEQEQILIHPAKLTQASLSEPALKVPPTVMATQYQLHPESAQCYAFPALKSRRPSRFLKLPSTTPLTTTAQPAAFPPTPSTSSSSPTPTIIFSTNHSVTSSSSSSMQTQQDSSSTNSMEDQQTAPMTAFHHLYETFTHKLYMEGYVMKHQLEEKTRTKMFLELCGSVMTLWEAEYQTTALATSSVMPTRFYHLADHTVVSSETVKDEKQYHYLFTVKNKTTSITFETSDEKSLKKWVLAIRLSCFEKQKLHQLFTLRQLTGLTVEGADHVEQGTWLQVKLSYEAHWQKFWVVLDSAVDSSNKKKKKHMFSHLSYKKQQQQAAVEEDQQHIFLFESKKSKQPLFTLTKVTQGYAIYPESMQLIEKNSMLRFECQLTTTAAVGDKHIDKATCWFMADHSQLTFQWLLRVYDTFQLYGRPGDLLVDGTHPDALNYGEPLTAKNQQRLFMEVEEAVYHLPTTGLEDQQVSESLFNNIIYIKQQQQVTKNAASTRRITDRANSLPLITVSETDTEDGQPKDNSKSLDLATVAMLSPAAYKLTRQVADSSDEDEDDNDEEQSEDDEEIEEDDQHETEEEDDENIPPTAALTSFASSLIPDFNLGNGFDVSHDASQAAVTAALTSTATEKKKKTKRRTTRHHSSIAIFGSLELEDKEATSYQYKGSFPLHTRKASMPNPPKPKASLSTASRRSLNSTTGPVTQLSISPASTPSSPELTSKTTTDLFGDFDLVSDFGNFLKEPSFSSPRKYSLPADVRLNASTSSINSGEHWEDYDIEDQRRPSSHHSRRPQRAHLSQRHHQHRSRHPYDGDEDVDDEASEEQRRNYDEYEGIEEGRSTGPQRDPHYVYYQRRRSQETDEDDSGEDNDDEDDNGPLIPSLGDHFAPQNSLLDTYLGEQLSAKEQIEYAKATGQPLIKVSRIKKEDKTTRTGLVGMISQREKDRKEGTGLRVAERVNQHNLDKLEKEKERKLFEQRQQQIYQHQMMLFANGYGLPPPPVMPVINAIGPVMNSAAVSGPASPRPISPMGPMSPLTLAMMHQQQQQQQQQPSPSPSTHRSMTPPATTFLSPQLAQYNPYFPSMTNVHPYFSPQPYAASPVPGASSTSTSPTPTPMGMPYSQPASAMGFYYYPQQQLLQPHPQATGRYSQQHVTTLADTRRRSSSAKSISDDLLMTAKTTTSTSTSSSKSNTRRSALSPHPHRLGRQSISSSSEANTITTTNSSISSATSSSSSSSRPSVSSSGSGRTRT